MKARTINLKGLRILAAILTIFLSWGVASADFHNGYDCVDCHDLTGQTSNASLVAEYVPWDADCPGGPQNCGNYVTFTGSDAYPWDYVYGDPDYTGICEVCHDLYDPGPPEVSGTKYYTKDGSGADHPPVTCPAEAPETPAEVCPDGDPLGTGGEPGSNCMLCHSHCNQFSHCSDPQAGCHESISHKTHTEGTAKGPDPLACIDCHDPAISGEPWNGDPFDATDMAAAGQCDDCHSPGGAFNGVTSVGNSIGAAENWNDIYEEDEQTLKPGKEKWCVGCHDDEPASSQPAPEEAASVVVDNPDATFNCTWGTSTALEEQRYGDDFRYIATGSTIDCTATWAPDLTAAGYYDVYAWWTSSTSRANNVPYTINHLGGPTTVWVDQTGNGGDWYALGTYEFAAGTSGTVVVRADDATGGPWVSADAVKFTKAPDGIYVDNTDASFDCTWGTSSAFPTERFGPDFRYIAAGSTTDCEAIWVP
ncbi:MAG: hypothetical protein SWQ30_22080, partial [Thermodesulfobacteriota bacterium]|nr:hypothetical protein [Thermodesulfobacteriota bacterium]